MELIKTGVIPQDDGWLDSFACGELLDAPPQLGSFRLRKEATARHAGAATLCVTELYRLAF